jgi:toxin ParE1/3/4
MKPFIVHSQARADLDEAMAFYEERRPGLGLNLLDEVELALADIRRNPKLGSPYKSTRFRRLRLRRFPYNIFYAELEDVTWVVAIAHTSRRPDYWRRRRIG